MGLDEDHMPFARMAKAIPPVYAAFLFGQVVRHALKSRFGVSVPSWDDAQSDLPRARREMAHLLRGAGGVSPHMGVELTTIGPDQKPSDEGEGSRELVELPARSGWGITELAAREIELSFAGGCDAALMSSDARHWLGGIRDVRRLSLSSKAEQAAGPVSYTHLTLPTTPYV